MRKSNSDQPSDENNDSLQTQREQLLALAKQEGYEIVPCTKACAYLRTSTDNDISMKIQRDRLLALAEREGYEIVQWYTDDCSLGIEPVQRHGWLALLADAATAAWVVILCLNRTRFSYLNATDNGVALLTLKQAGKKLHTAIEGLVDWDATACEIIDQMIDNEDQKS